MLTAAPLLVHDPVVILGPNPEAIASREEDSYS